MYKICIITLIACLCYHAGFTQAKSSPSHDSLILNNGTVLHVGDTLQLGKVSGKSNRFQYLYTPPVALFLYTKMHPYKVYEGEDVIIEKFERVYASKGKSKIVAVISSKRVGLHYVDSNPAFESGEIASVRKKIVEEEEEETP